MGIDERLIDPALAHQNMQKAVEQRDIGAWLDRQVQIGNLAGIGAPRVDDHDALAGVVCLGLLQAAEQYRVGVGHVAADDDHAIAQLNVFIRAGRRIGTQAALVANHG